VSKRKGRFKVGDRVVEPVAGPGTVVDCYDWGAAHAYRVACDASWTYTLDEEVLEPEPAVVQLANIVREEA